MFGTLDASLRFTRVEGRRPQAPTPQRRDLTLVSGGVRDRRSPDDRARAASGGMPWKIASHRDPFGHYVGLDVHDPGDLSVPLKAGTIITIEPGIYIPEENIGIRIEDMVLVTADGSKVLSAALPARVRSRRCASSRSHFTGGRSRS